MMYPSINECAEIIMGCPTRIEMPPKDGKEIPNRFRYTCDNGHIHPSHRAAVKCNVKHRQKK